MRRAIEDGAATAGDKRISPSSRKEDGATKQQAPSSSATGHEDDHKKIKRISPADTIRQISAASDLRRLARVLSHRRINTSCRGTFSAAIRDGNPAVIDMWLRHGKQHGGVSFLEAFRSWGEAGLVGGDRSPPSLPLHLSCHAGSPEVVSVRNGVALVWRWFPKSRYRSKRTRCGSNLRKCTFLSQIVPNLKPLSSGHVRVNPLFPPHTRIGTESSRSTVEGTPFSIGAGREFRFLFFSSCKGPKITRTHR